MYCIAPFSSLVINGSGSLAPCCAIQQFNSETLKPELSISTNFERSNKKLQSLFLSDAPDEEKFKFCRNCTQVVPPAQNVMHNELADKNIDYTATPTLTNLHLRASNFCNLACRMCNSISSNLIAKERGEFGNANKKYEYSSINDETPDIVSSIIDQLPKLKMLWLSGGEPLINDKNWLVLRKAYEQGHSKNITLHINTNGTINLTDEEIDIFNSFKKVELHVSLDGVDEVGEYIRTNLKVASWVENVKRYKEKLSANSTEIALVYSISALNISRIRGILLLAKMIGIQTICNYVHYPEELCIKNMNDECKAYINILYKDRPDLSPILYYMNLPRDIDPSKAVKHIDSLDDNVIKKGLYNNYKPFKEVDPFWYNMLKGSQT